MWRCEGCKRHVLAVSPLCPFCAKVRIAALGMAVAAPVLLSACYGLPPCNPKDLTDADGDGYSANTGFCYTSASIDCDDTDPAINPGATEVCGDKIDQNCDGIFASVNQPEICGNGLDDNCDGVVDEAVCQTPYATPTTPYPLPSGTTGSTGDTAGPTGSTGSGGSSGPTGSTGGTGAPATGSLSLTYTWSAGSPILSCTDAGVVLIDATVDESGPTAPTVTGYACDDQPVPMSGLDPAAYAIEFTAQSSDGIRTWDSGPMVVDVTSGVTTPIALVLTCSSTVTGGCD